MALGRLGDEALPLRRAVFRVIAGRGLALPSLQRCLGVLENVELVATTGELAAEVVGRAQQAFGLCGLGFVGLAVFAAVYTTGGPVAADVLAGVACRWLEVLGADMAAHFQLS